MPITAPFEAPAGALDCATALELLKEYKRDGLDVNSLLDSDKRGGLTYVNLNPYSAESQSNVLSAVTMTS